MAKDATEWIANKKTLVEAEKIVSLPLIRQINVALTT